MKGVSVIERLRQVELSRHAVNPDRSELEAVLRDITSIRGWLNAVEADLATR